MLRKAMLRKAQQNSPTGRLDTMTTRCVALARKMEHGIHNSDELIDATRTILEISDKLQNFEPDINDTAEMEAHDTCVDALNNLVRSENEMYARYDVTPNIAEVLRKYSLSPLECRILMACACCSLSMLPHTRIHDVDDLIGAFKGLPDKRMDVIRAASVKGRLVESTLLKYQAGGRRNDSEYALVTDACISVSSEFVRSLLNPDHSFINEWQCATQEKLVAKLRIICNQLVENEDDVDDYESGDDTFLAHTLLLRSVERFMAAIQPEWPLEDLKALKLDDDELHIVLALLSKETMPGSPRGGFFRRDTPKYTGEWLARAVADGADRVHGIIRECLMPDKRLTKEDIIRPVHKGLGEKKKSDETDIRDTEFEIHPDMLARLGIKSREKYAQAGRDPLVTMDQLALDPKTARELELVVSQVENKETLRTWAVGENIAYGLGVTMMFYGPPGTGKTAAAEAIASRLGKKILVADYSEMVNCYVGETGKNISRAFRNASRNDCVLFLDEADSMFFDRSKARQDFQARDVNIILKELENFEGVCILATNHRVHMDPALARRVSAKIEFQAPTPEQAKAIWTKLLPKGMPLADDVNVEELSQFCLTGGEIKNVVLNVARSAAMRGADAVAQRQEFLDAVQRELETKENDAYASREPRMTMDQLVLDAAAEKKIDTALSHLANADTLKAWKLDQTIPYGSGVTMLFYGPAGTGKTAAAESIAARLGKKILVADYGALMDGSVGEVQKNVSRLFHNAQTTNAVLFWDEADALFFDRGSADNNWQSQIVNVLLQELEKFTGVCILSTNHQAVLDKAVARRLSAKVEFRAPTPEQARQIWTKLLPPAMPLDSDVDLDEMSRQGLTGGEIKNVVLCAARTAAMRGQDAKASRQDFMDAIREERASKTLRTDKYSQTTEHIGF